MQRFFAQLVGMVHSRFLSDLKVTKGFWLPLELNLKLVLKDRQCMNGAVGNW